MSSDYRTRRRRRGGRGRRRDSNSKPEPKKKKGLFARMFGWLFGQKSSSSRNGAPGKGKPNRRDREQASKERPAKSRKEPLDVTEEDITTEKLYVGNLPYEVGESELFDLFEKEGQVRNVEVVTDRSGTRSKGFGFVEMTHLESAKKAAVKLNRTDFMGRQLIVNSAKTDRR